MEIILYKTEVIQLYTDKIIVFFPQEIIMAKYFLL